MQRFVLLCACLIALVACDCFPKTRGWGNGPNGMSRKDWFCGDNDLYGFLGFSYPLEDDDCDDYSYDNFVSDFNKMKSMYGATFVRTYLPACRQTDFWVKMVKACRDTSMALIPMVFWDWNQNDPIMYAAENALLGVFTDPEVGSIAPYIIQSVAFGDELGEQGDYWIGPLKDFKNKLSPYNVTVTITDDWDRDVYRNSSWNGLNDFGNQVNDICDMTQTHIMPYYHPDQCPDAWHFWTYYINQMNFMVDNNMKRPFFITETMWAYNQDGHQRQSNNDADNMDNYVQYWNTINGNCNVFKQYGVGWFFHTWFGEPGFDIIGSDGQPVFNFQIQTC